MKFLEKYDPSPPKKVFVRGQIILANYIGTLLYCFLGGFQKAREKLSLQKRINFSGWSYLVHDKSFWGKQQLNLYIFYTTSSTSKPSNLLQNLFTFFTLFFNFILNFLWWQICLISSTPITCTLKCLKLYYNKNSSNSHSVAHCRIHTRRSFTLLWLIYGNNHRQFSSSSDFCIFFITSSSSCAYFRNPFDY